MFRPALLSPAWRHFWRSPLVPGLLALWVILGVSELCSPFFFLHDDNATWFTPAYFHDYQVLTQTGRLAEIDFFQYGGEPFLRQGQSGTLYPPVYLCMGLALEAMGDVRWAIELMAALHLTLGLVGFYAWMRQLGVERWSSILGGLAWVFSPFVILVGLNWISVIIAAGFLPWLWWAMDRLLARPSLSSSFALGGVLGLFFLQGMVQWVVYSALFLAIYAGMRLASKSEVPRGPIIHHLALSAMVFLTLAFPLFVPMRQAALESVAREHPFSLLQAMEGCVWFNDLLRAQVGMFHPGMVFQETSTALLFYPALLLFPLVFPVLFRGNTSLQRPLMHLTVLSVLALLFSSPFHLLLRVLPFFDRFRWPFKVFLFAEFFLCAALVLGLACWLRSQRFPEPKGKWIAMAFLLLLACGNLSFSLSRHDGNYFSSAVLPTLQNPLPMVDPQRGRIMAFVESSPVSPPPFKFLPYRLATLFAIPNIGGYNPIVSRDHFLYGLKCDNTATYNVPLSSELREEMNQHAIRYCLMDTRLPQAVALGKWPGMRELENRPDRIVYENLQAVPLVCSVAQPEVPLPFTYRGNSLLIPLSQPTTGLACAVSPTDGWWFRLDHGSWQRAVYRNQRVEIATPAETRRVELSYFDPLFRRGLIGALISLVVLGCWIAGQKWIMERA